VSKRRPPYWPVEGESAEEANTRREILADRGVDLEDRILLRWKSQGCESVSISLLAKHGAFPRNIHPTRGRRWLG
jgi:hypothetical protein